jgi:hypothetical protein
MSGEDKESIGVVQRFIGWLQGPESDGWVELVAVMLLSTASLTAAWSGYQAAVWGGQQTTLYSEASATRIEANRASTNAYLYTLIDTQLFNDYAVAFTDDDEALMTFYERQFPQRLQVAFEAWRATDPLNNPDAPPNPFAMEEYVIEDRERASQFTDESESLFERGIVANENSKAFVLNTVYLASVLFLAGIATKVRGKPARIFLVSLASVLLIYGIFDAASLPMASV